MEKSGCLFFQVQYNKIYFRSTIRAGIIQEKVINRYGVVKGGHQEVIKVADNSLYKNIFIMMHWVTYKIAGKAAEAGSSLWLQGPVPVTGKLPPELQQAIKLGSC